MDREVYDKIYIEDNYSRQFGELRERYYDRTQQALAARSTDADPVPNATTVVLLNDTPDGGVTITTADFVAFYNERHGYDRVGEMRRAIAESAHRVEVKQAKKQAMQQAAQQAEHREERVRKQAETRKPREIFRPRFSFVYAAFSAALVCSLVLFFGANAALNESKAELASLENELASVQVVESGEKENYDLMQLAERATLEGDKSEENTPENADEGMSMAGLLNALSGMSNE